MFWGEVPDQTKKKTRGYKRLCRRYSRKSVVTSEVLMVLQAIVEEHPEYYLDEIAAELGLRTRCYLSYSTLWQTLKNKLGYSLNVCYEAAAQRDNYRRRSYKDALNILLTDVHQVVFIDETHKDKNSSRRRRAWGRRGSDGVILRRWFRESYRYTMIAALDVCGFVPSSIKIIPRSDDGDKNGRGTVDREAFECWVEEHLVPVLGRYSDGEARSVVVMDNASIHMSEKVHDMIHGAGAYLLYTAPYSPDLNPIELAFNIYKSHLKRNSSLFEWLPYQAHGEAIESVTKDMCIKEFQRCGVPGSNVVKTLTELEEEEDEMMLILTVVVLLVILGSI